jgi:drug/metabolite transporter (DMT)-like permease
VEKKQSAGKIRIWLALIGVYLGWGATYLANHYALEAFPAFIMNGMRNLLAGIFLYTFQRVRGAPPPTGKMWKSAFVVGFIMLCCGSGINVWGQGLAPSGVSSLLIGSIPLWMVILDIFISRRAKIAGPNAIAVFGVFIGFAGIVLLIGPGNIMGSQAGLNPLGTAALLTGSFFWAVGSLKSRTAVFPPSRILGSSMQMIAGGITLVLAGILMGEPARISFRAAGLFPVLGFVYGVFFGSLFSFALYTWLLGVAPTPLVSTYAYANPVVAVILGTLVLDEAVTLRLVIASAMILAAVAVVSAASGVKPRASVQSRPDSG